MAKKKKQEYIILDPTGVAVVTKKKFFSKIDAEEEALKLTELAKDLFNYKKFQVVKLEKETAMN